MILCQHDLIQIGAGHSGSQHPYDSAVFVRLFLREEGPVKAPRGSQ
jgi:hypothetical protein